MLTRVGVPVTSEAEASAPDSQPDTLICFSHLRWNFVFQRPQHLMGRFAKNRRVFFIEEPIYDGADFSARPEIKTCPDTGVVCVTPHLPSHRSRFANEEALKDMLDRLI